MKRLKTAIARMAIAGDLLLGIWVFFAYRARPAFSYARRTFSNLFTWMLKSRETTNFTYDLEGRNKRYLASLIADITNQPYELIESYIREVETDSALHQHIRDGTAKSDQALIADKDVTMGGELAGMHLSDPSSRGLWSRPVSTRDLVHVCLLRR